MEEQNKYELLIKLTTKESYLWKHVKGIAPNPVSDKFDIAMLEWQVELTETLKIWIDKGTSMTDGELILARVNLGAVVESWLKFFYCAYYEDYREEQYSKNKKNKKNKIKGPEKETFEMLKEFSNGKLWDNSNSPEYIWVDSVQKKRNAIHSFTFRDIGTPKEFLDDVNYLYDFANNIVDQLPLVEEYMNDMQDNM